MNAARRVVGVMGLVILVVLVVVAVSGRAGVAARAISFRDCAQCPEMIVIRGGTFFMGSPASEPGHTIDEEPRHRVTIARPFALARDDVTFDQWDACAADRGCGGFRPTDQGWGRGLRPVIGVSFDDARAYVAWLSRHTGRPYRLPTEAEWEYAARAGSAAPFSFGSRIDARRANFNGALPYAGSPASVFRAKTMPVGTFAPNAFGLDDMNGNAAQWVEDCMHATYAGAPVDGRAWYGDDCGERIVRGGSWASEGWLVRSAMRFGVGATYRSRYVGFRVATSDVRAAASVAQSVAQPVAATGSISGTVSLDTGNAGGLAAVPAGATIAIYVGYISGNPDALHQTVFAGVKLTAKAANGTPMRFKITGLPLGERLAIHAEVYALDRGPNGWDVGLVRTDAGPDATITLTAQHPAVTTVAFSAKGALIPRASPSPAPMKIVPGIS